MADPNKALKAGLYVENFRSAREKIEKTWTLSGDAAPEWYDDGQIHVLSLEKRGDTVSGALDGAEQFRLQAPGLKPGALGFGSEQAAVAVYSCKIAEAE